MVANSFLMSDLVGPASWFVFFPVIINTLYDCSIFISMRDVQIGLEM